jgi:hypothetical protein
MTATEPTKVELDAHVDLLRRLTEAQNAAKAWTSIANGLRDQIEKLIGDAEVGTVNGEEALTFSWVDSFRSTDFKKQQPDLYRRYEVDTTVRKLDVDWLKRTQPELYREYQTRRFVNKFGIG